MDYAKAYKDLGLSFDCVYSSPLKRAYTTAFITVKELHHKSYIQCSLSLIERDFGAAEGTKINNEVYDDIINDRIEGIEKTEDFIKRVRKGIDEIVRKNEGKTILIVTHSHTIKGFLYTIDNSVLATSPMRNMSLTKVIYDNGEYKIEFMNKLPEEL